MRPHQRDLFGEVIVTHDDVAAWLMNVPRINPYGRRARFYVAQYAVVEKITRAKLAGTFDAIVTRPEPPSQWWERFHWRY